MEKKFISVKGAKENNLKNISVDIPKNKLVVITGVSGSGKSSLAFDVLYNEGKRRYIDSLSNYARQFLGGTTKPDVEAIEGLSPAIAIGQKTTSNNPRSTVGTVTEIYDFYRLLFSRIGKPFCPYHDIEISSQTITEILDQIYKYKEGTEVQILAPKVIGEKGTHKKLLDNLKGEGFLRVRINDVVYRLDSEINLEKNKRHNISIIIDRVIINKENRERLFEAIQLASEETEGLIRVKNVKTEESELFSTKYACPHGDFSIGKLEPRIFSFNSPQGACDKCKGLGIIEEVTWEKLVNPMLTILEGGLLYFGEKLSGVEWQEFEVLLSHYDISITKKLSTFTKEEKDLILYGSTEEIIYMIKTDKRNVRKNDRIEGLADKIWRKYESTDSEKNRTYYSKFLGNKICDICNGQRLSKASLAVKINNMNIADLTKLSIKNSLDWINTLTLNQQEKEISSLIVDEITSRFKFLINVGLSYLTLDRMAGTLSGGEAQRIRLASQLGSRLTGILYVLDEPSIGLHQKDNEKLIKTLKDIRDLGNTVLVVEHDEETMYESDYIIDIGPSAGAYGGEISALGTPDEVSQSDSLTGKYLSGREYIEVPRRRRKGNGKTVKVMGASENNLKHISVTIPLNTFTVVTGVSGSGKSTLVNEIIYKGLHNKVTKFGNQLKTGKFNRIEGATNVDKVINISQEAIGRTPRSNPATYTGVFDHIRDLFAETKESKLRGYQKGRFSFNVPGGRCDKCNGDGIIKISMHFLPDVEVVCGQCNGKKYNEGTLQIKYKDKNIADILAMSVDEALEFFTNIPKIKNNLQFLKDVGLGYIQLGHSATLLSGGEAQRIKLATYLQKKPTGKTIYFLDEPTTGLHVHDVKELIKVLNRIVNDGDTLIIIEHNLDIIKSADYIIDLGPEGGENGGTVIASGTPEAVSGYADSATGVYLKQKLKQWSK